MTWESFGLYLCSESGYVEIDENAESGNVVNTSQRRIYAIKSVWYVNAHSINIINKPKCMANASFFIVCTFTRRSVNT